MWRARATVALSRPRRVSSSRSFAIRTKIILKPGTRFDNDEWTTVALTHCVRVWHNMSGRHYISRIVRFCSKRPRMKFILRRTSLGDWLARRNRNTWQRVSLILARFEHFLLLPFFFIKFFFCCIVTEIQHHDRLASLSCDTKLIFYQISFFFPKK